MVRNPAWMRAEEETLGRQVLNGDLEREEAAELLHDAIFDRDEPLTHDIVRAHTRKRMTRWVNKQVGDFYADDDREDETGERQMELFSWLPRLLETSPARFAHINTMTKRDWDAALKQAETKEGNASKYAKALRRAYEQVVPLLTEEWMTTADVAGQMG